MVQSGPSPHRGSGVGDPPDSRVVFALDYPDVDRARAGALAVCEAIGMVKVGLELFVHAGPRATEIGRECGRPVFLDLKLHDIPATVDGAVASACALRARMLTVHASGGPAMVRRAVERAAREGTGTEIAAVTVLTSLDERDLATIGVPGGIAAQVERLARMAWSEGVRTFVCSPHEAALLRAALGPGATLVTPGVRSSGFRPRSGEAGDVPSPGATTGDQKRTMSAGEAVAAGADWVVVGRPIRDAADPLAAARELAREVSAARGRG
jgi:orotidine-5'-phosphate decarboxylase